MARNTEKNCIENYLMSDIFNNTLVLKNYE